MSAMASLKDKVVIITGASGGIGEATALRLSEYGSRLVLTARGTEKLEEIAGKCAEAGLDKNKILVITADLTKDPDLKKIVSETIEKFGCIDVLINNAGILRYFKTIDTDMSVFDDVMRTNVRAPFYLSKLCLPHLKKSRGNIVNVSSISGQCTFTAEAAYGTSKAALDHFTEILAMEVAEFKIRVNSVNPGVVYTDMQRKAGFSNDKYDEYMERQKEKHPLGGVASALQVAKAITFLASDDADFTTGQIIFVDGGRHAKSF